VADITTADGTGGCVRRYFNVGELLNCGSNSFDVVLIVISLGRLALGKCGTLDEVHDDIPTLPAREAEVDFGNADDTRRAGVHDTCYVSLRTAFTSDDGVPAVFDPKSRLASYPDGDAVPVKTSSSAQANDFVAGREVCWDVHRTPNVVVSHGQNVCKSKHRAKELGDNLTWKSRRSRK